MREYIVASGSHVFVVAVADDKGTVLVFVIQIIPGGLIGIERGVVIRVEPFHPVYVQCRDMYVQNLKFVVFVAGRENQLAVVREFNLIGRLDVGLGIDHTVIPPAVLHYYGFQFTMRVDDFYQSVVDGEIHLLVGFVEVYVRIGTDGSSYSYARFHQTETGRKDGYRFVAFVVIDREFIVAG